jgi:hypothetical protein
MELSVTVICPSIYLCIVVKERTDEDKAEAFNPGFIAAGKSDPSGGRGWS